MGSIRLFVWVAVALVAVDLVFLSGASNFLAAPQSRILNQLIVLGSMAVFGVAVARGTIDLRSPLILPGVAWIAATAVAAMLSARPASSLEGLALLLLAAPAYLAVRAVIWTDWLRPRIDRLVVVTAAVFVVAYLAQALTQWIDWWSVAGLSVPPLRPGDVGLTVGTVNAVAVYLEALAPIAVWLSWMLWRSRRATVVLASLSLAAFVVTGSRGAWLGAALGVVVLAAMLWFDAGRPLPRVPRDPRRGVVVGGGIVVAGVGLLALGPALITRLASGDAGRIELWSAAWSMFVADPITGAGPGAFPDVRPLSPISEANLAVLTTSHNSILQVLAETGLVGAVAAAWLLVALVWTARRALRFQPRGPERVLRQVSIASLAAIGAHSIVDTQFHLPAVVLLTFHLVARLDPPSSPEDTPVPARRTPRAALAIAAAAVALGGILLVPIDIAMVRAQLGNLALDQGDDTVALADFEAAIALHELGPYRLGEAIARSRLGDPAGAEAAFERMVALQPFTFAMAGEAAVAAETGDLVDRLDAQGPYDPTATVNVAVIRYPSDPVAAERDLAAAMIAAPTLIYSDRPAELFDDAIWAGAQRQAIDAIGEQSPLGAAVFAGLARQAGLADEYRAAAPDGPEADAVDLLLDAVRTGATDLTRASALLRANPGSVGVIGTLWLLGFEAGHQPLIDDVRRVSIPLLFGTPLPPLELVVDGRTDADWSLRLPRYPMSSNGRLGPDRPYPAGMVTIEPVFRPKP